MVVKRRSAVLLVVSYLPPTNHFILSCSVAFFAKRSSYLVCSLFYSITNNRLCF